MAIEEQLAKNLATNLRYLRDRRGLTQQRLAKLCGVPRSTLGQIESGSGNPTLSVLARLTLALQLSIEELVSAPHARCTVFRQGTLPSSRHGGVSIQKLLPDPIPGMEIDRMELAPGARQSGVPHRPGTREYLVCERGGMTLWAASERLDLKCGDVASFDGDQPHSYHNGGRVTAVGFSVVTLAHIGASAGARPASDG